MDHDDATAAPAPTRTPIPVGGRPGDGGPGRPHAARPFGLPLQPTPGAREPHLRDLIGRVLRDRRQRLGDRLVDVAERAGVSSQYLSEIERGLKDPSSEIVAAVADALGLDLDELLAALARARGLDVAEAVPEPPRLSVLRGDDPAIRDVATSTPGMSSSTALGTDASCLAA